MRIGLMLGRARTSLALRLATLIPLAPRRWLDAGTWSDSANWSDAA